MLALTWDARETAPEADVRTRADGGWSDWRPMPVLTDAPDAVPLDRVAGRVDFDHVGFAYGRDAGGLQDVDLHIRAGEKVGIVGASGAGKSTMVALLLRLYDVEKGAIRIDGQDLRHVTQESLPGGNCAAKWGQCGGQG